MVILAAPTEPMTPDLAWASALVLGLLLLGTLLTFHRRGRS